MNELQVNDKVRLYRRDSTERQWQEMPYKAVVKSLSYNKDHEPIFALVTGKEERDKEVYFEELVTINSSCFKLVKH